MQTLKQKLWEGPRNLPFNRPCGAAAEVSRLRAAALTRESQLGAILVAPHNAGPLCGFVTASRDAVGTCQRQQLVDVN